MEIKSTIPATTRKCYKCENSFNSYLNSNAYSLICPSCGQLYRIYNGVLDKTTDVIKKPVKQLDIPIGTTGTINEILYQVIGYTCKNEEGSNYYWHEYSLFNPIHGSAFLSQYDGHWMFLKELNSLPKTYSRTASYKNVSYSLFSRYTSKIASATGEFIYLFSDSEKTSVEEFVVPGYLISKEITSDNLTWYKGEYIEPEIIKTSFKLKTVPNRKGVGMIQPFVGKFSTEGFKTILIALTIIWGIAQFYFSSTAKDELAFRQHFTISDSLNKKEIYTKPFDLKYGTTNAEVKINTNIDNNWMYTAITLVNENTGDVYDVDLEAEYYHGYSGGENWSEGSSWISKVVSQVPEGRYSMVIYPSKPENMAYVALDVSVRRDVPIFSNGLLVFLLLAIFPVYYFYRKTSFEKKRWYNSNYSQYD